MDRIPHHEVDFHPHSFGDPDGRLFWWQGQLYRGIRSGQAPLFARLFQDGVIRRLIDRGLLIDTELTTLAIDGYAMVVRHRHVPFASYPNEWCMAMFKDATLTYLDLVTELAQHGLTLKDTHPWNLLFDACTPVYVDLTSITLIPDGRDLLADDKFRRYYLYPLLLMSDGHERIVRCLLPEYDGISKTDFLMLTRGRAASASPLEAMRSFAAAVRRRLPPVFHRRFDQGMSSIRSLFRQQPHSPHSQVDSLRDMRRQVESISLPPPDPESADSCGKAILSSQDTWTAKQRDLHRILTELGPCSVLDIGSNRGWYSRLAALVRSRVVAFDIDPTPITQLYYEARDGKLPILPLIMDFTKPTPAIGFAGHFSIAATDRFKCDLVLALDFLHHVIFQRSLNFDQIVEGLASFSKRWVVAEFVPRQDRSPGDRLSDRFNWYTRENFIAALGKQFRTVKIVSSDPKPGTLLLCEK